MSQWETMAFADLLRAAPWATGQCRGRITRLQLVPGRVGSRRPGGDLARIVVYLLLCALLYRKAVSATAQSDA